MCQDLSSIQIKDGSLLHHFGVSSHEDIIAIFGLKDDKPIPDFVRLEYTPPTPFSLDFDQWNFKVDQDLLPDWFDPEYAKRVCRKFVVSQPVMDGEYDALAGQYYFVTGKVKRLVGRGTIMWLCGSAQVKYICGSAQVKYISGSGEIYLRLS